MSGLRRATTAALLAVVAASSRAQAPPTPRTLVIVLDGVPHRVVARAVEKGAFAGWPEPSRLVAPFPSMTNPSLTLLLSPLGVAPAPGYELQHYDWDENRIHGGGAFEHREGAFPWREHVQVPESRLSSKFFTYARPHRHFARHLRWAERTVLGDPNDVVVLHLGALDALHHVKGDDAVEPLVASLDPWARELAARHERELGRPLRFVLLSDHGNSATKIRRLFGGRDVLRDAGLRVQKHLERPGDVVVGTFGVNGYAALYTDAEHAAPAARAMTTHPGVDLAAWVTGPGEVRVVGDEGETTLRWSDAGAERRLGVVNDSGDPLALTGALETLRAQGLLGADGLAPARAWLEATADAPYPDAPARIIDGLTGPHVVHRATVLVSLEPGWAWGWKSAATFAWFRGGALEGTHGGLDHDSSIGFVLVSDPACAPGPVVRPADALAPCLGEAPAAGR